MSVWKRAFEGAGKWKGGYERFTAGCGYACSRGTLAGARTFSRAWVDARTFPCRWVGARTCWGAWLDTRTFSRGLVGGCAHISVCVGGCAHIFSSVGRWMRAHFRVRGWMDAHFRVRGWMHAHVRVCGWMHAHFRVRGGMRAHFRVRGWMRAHFRVRGWMRAHFRVRGWMRAHVRVRGCMREFVGGWCRVRLACGYSRLPSGGCEFRASGGEGALRFVYDRASTQARAAAQEYVNTSQLCAQSTYGFGRHGAHSATSIQNYHRHNARNNPDFLMDQSATRQQGKTAFHSATRRWPLFLLRWRSLAELCREPRLSSRPAETSVAHQCRTWRSRYQSCLCLSLLCNTVHRSNGRRQKHQLEGQELVMRNEKNGVGRHVL